MLLDKRHNTKSAVLSTYIAMIIIWLNDKKTFAQNALNDVLIKRLNARCTNATSEPILNIVKNLVRKLFEYVRKFF